MFTDVVAEVVECDDDRLVQRLRDLEGRRREVEAESAVVLAELERRRAFRADGHASMWGLLRVAVGWSDRECRERTRLARLVDRFVDAGEVLFEAQASIANVVEIARAAANPRCGEQIDEVIGTLLREACRSEHDDLKVVVRRWERRADVDGAFGDREATHANRNAHVVVWDGVGHAAAQWGEIDGLANREVFERFVDAEWRADWEACVAEHGDAAARALMARTDAQRRADAMTRIFQTAASTPPGSRTADPVVNIHVDHQTFRDVLTEAELVPARVIDPFEPGGIIETARRCETDHGDPLDPRIVLQLAIEGWVRFAIHDDHGVPIRWGRTRRFFDGAARAAVMSQSHRCRHPGCRVRARRCDIDHTVDFAKGGPTDPANASPRCRRHNLIKNHGYTTWRDRTGAWHTYRPDGTEIT